LLGFQKKLHKWSKEKKGEELRVTSPLRIGVKSHLPTEKEKREKAVQKSVTGDVSSGVLNQDRLQPLLANSDPFYSLSF